MKDLSMTRATATSAAFFMWAKRLGLAGLFAAAGDASPYPELDAAMGVTGAMGAAFANADAMTTAVGVTFADEPLYANASSL